MAEPKKPSIPSPSDPSFNEAVKETLEIITGRRPNVAKLAKLEGAASTSDIINKINELLDRIQ